MKVLILQENGRHEANRAFRECFSLQRALLRRPEVAGCDVWGQGHDGFPEPPDFSSYQVLVNLENYDTGWVPDLSPYSGTYKLLWCIDAHCKTMAPYRQEFQRGRYQLILQATRDYLDRDSVWFPNCADTDLIGPRTVPPSCAVGFCGSLLDRKPYLDLLRRHFDFRADIFVLGEAMVSALNSYRVHFNKNLSCDVNYRNFETLACGVPLLTSASPQYAELGLRSGENCMVWKSRGELREAARFLLDQPHRRAEIARAGLELSGQHTYAHRAGQLVELLKARV